VLRYRRFRKRQRQLLRHVCFAMPREPIAKTIEREVDYGRRKQRQQLTDKKPANDGDAERPP